ncbi:MAG TPA: hypothetical protein VLJ88_11635 [Propionibacteriaceae bacterium]|nr:hypothetical protein [Propionibacteriaceae bacterium]
MTTTITAPGVIETVRLSDGDFTNENEARSIRALLFAAMLERAEPVVKHYRSDLFHDALWIHNHVNGEMTWHWLVRECGTNLNETADTMIRLGVGPHAVYYKVTLTKCRFAWTVTFESLPLHR